MMSFKILLLISTFIALSLQATIKRGQNRWWENCGRSKYPDAGENTQRIVGGIEASIGEFPWQVSFRWLPGAASNHFCGAMIISPRWVLTAAHCAEGELPNEVAVVVGEHDSSSGINLSRRVYNIESIFMHADYDVAEDYDADIALLKTTEDIQFDEDVQPICAPEANVTHVDMTSQVSGWGTTKSGKPCCESVLLYTTLPIPPNPDCEFALQTVLGDTTVVTDGMICAGDIPENIRDSCQGDSGGPLSIKKSDGTFEAIGIVSWGYSCAGGTPGVYARVNYYLDWIDNIMQGN